MKHINRGPFLGHIVPIPPLREQERIANKIDELFGEIEAGEQELEKAREGLETYRRAVLKAAITGELTREWREKNAPNETGAHLLSKVLAERRTAWPDKRAYREAGTLDTSSLPPLPSGWIWASVEQLMVTEPRNGISVQGRNEPPGTPALRLDALTYQGLDFARCRYIEIPDRKRDAIVIRAGDFLVSRANGSKSFVGRACLASEPPTLMVFPDTMIRFRFSGSSSVLRWVEAIWRSDLVRSQIENLAKTSAGIWKVSQDDLLRIRLPLPPELECRLALERSSDLMRSAEEATGSLEGELPTIARLRQSILAAAFSGKLVPQDLADEPATALLERLRTAKAAAPARPRRATPRVPRRRGASGDPAASAAHE